jgi:hypothetical protein
MLEWHAISLENIAEEGNQQNKQSLDVGTKCDQEDRNEDHGDLSVKNNEFPMRLNSLLTCLTNNMS